MRRTHGIAVVIEVTAARDRHLVVRQEKPRAAGAIGHAIPVSAYHVVARQQDYQEIDFHLSPEVEFAGNVLIALAPHQTVNETFGEIVTAPTSESRDLSRDCRM